MFVITLNHLRVGQHDALLNVNSDGEISGKNYVQSD